MVKGGSSDSALILFSLAQKEVNYRYYVGVARAAPCNTYTLAMPLGTGSSHFFTAVAGVVRLGPGGHVVHVRCMQCTCVSLAQSFPHKLVN